MRLTHLCTADIQREREGGRAGEISLQVQAAWDEVASLGHGEAASPLCSAQKSEAPDSWEHCGPFHSCTFCGLSLFPFK